MLIASGRAGEQKMGTELRPKEGVAPLFLWRKKSFFWSDCLGVRLYNSSLLAARWCRRVHLWARPEKTINQALAIVFLTRGNGQAIIGRLTFAKSSPTRQ